jgi:hypothetical protein
MKRIILIILTSILISSCTKDDLGSDQYQNLRLGYHFDDFSNGKAIDFSSTLVGTNVKDQKNDAIPSDLNLVNGINGMAISFETATSGLHIPYGLGTFSNQFVFDFWINLKSQPTEEFRNIISETRAGHASTFRVGIVNNWISFDFMKYLIITEGVKSTFKLEENSWYHIAFIYNGSELKLFINGELNDSKSILMGAIDSWNYLNCGYYDNSSSTDRDLAFYGILDEFRIWDYKFTDDDVKNYLMTTFNP